MYKISKGETLTRPYFFILKGKYIWIQKKQIILENVSRIYEEEAGKELVH